MEKECLDCEKLFIEDSEEQIYCRSCLEQREAEGDYELEN